MRVNFLRTVALVSVASLVSVSGCGISGLSGLAGTWIGTLQSSTSTRVGNLPVVMTSSTPTSTLVFDSTGKLVSYQLLAFGDLGPKTVTINEVGQSVSFSVTAGGFSYNGVATVTNAVYTPTSTQLTVAISLVGTLSNGSGVQTLIANLNSNGTLATVIEQDISYVAGGVTTLVETDATGTLYRQ